MAVRIRLRRMGAKRQPSYRLVVADARAPRDGRFIDVLGYYNPLREPAEVVVDEDKALMWLGRGAQPTETARDLLERKGVLAKFREAGGKIAVAPEPEREVKEEKYTEAPLEELAIEAGAEEEAMAGPEPAAEEEIAAKAEAETLVTAEETGLAEAETGEVSAAEAEAPASGEEAPVAAAETREAEEEVLAAEEGPAAAAEAAEEETAPAEESGGSKSGKRG